jgi:uncharacterized membrane protein YccC
MNAESEHRTPPAEPLPSLVSKPSGQPYTETREFGLWTVLGVFALGAAIGAGAAVFAAPDSGSRTRRKVGRRLRKLTRRERTAWDKLGRTLRRAVEERRIQRRAERLADEKAAAEG